MAGMIHDSQIKISFEEKGEKEIRLLREERDFQSILESFTSKGN